MTKNTGVGRGNNPQSHKNTKRGADHCRWNSQQIISSHGYVKVRVGIGHQLAAIQQAAELLGLGGETILTLELSGADKRPLE